MSEWRLRAIRGAITVDEDTSDQVVAATKRLIEEMVSRNGLQKEDLVSMLFTCTSDLRSEFPAAGARQMGMSDVPMLCATELDIRDSPLAVARCIRIMMHVYTDRDYTSVRHVYLEGARHLRPDLAD